MGDYFGASRSAGYLAEIQISETFRAHVEATDYPESGGPNVAAGGPTAVQTRSNSKTSRISALFRIRFCLNRHDFQEPWYSGHLRAETVCEIPFGAPR